MQETIQLNLSYHSFTLRSKRLSRIGRDALTGLDSLRKEFRFHPAPKGDFKSVEYRGSTETL